jgi:competence protein ComEC
MSSLHVRPLFWMSLAFVVGVAAGRQIAVDIPCRLLLAAAALALLFAALGVLPRFAAWRSPFAGMLCFGLMGMLAAHLAASSLRTPAAISTCFSSRQTLYLAELVAPATFEEDRAKLQIHLIHAVGADRSIPVDADIVLTVGRLGAGGARWLPGERFLACLTVKPLRGLGNPGGFDYVAYQAEKGIYGRAYLSDDRSLVRVRDPSREGGLVSFTPLGVLAVLDAFRQETRQWLKSHLPEDAADFYGALLLGYPLPARWNDHLNRTGLAHLLSISGLHLGFVSLGVFWITCRLIRFAAPRLLLRTSDQQIARWPAMAAVTAYALVSGLAIPTWRSLIMLALFTWAMLRQRLPDGMSTLALAALAILMAWPNSIGQVSFQLSFAAMIGLFVVYPNISRRVFGDALTASGEHRVISRLLRPFAEAFWVSLAVNLMVLPVIIHHFHGLSLAGFPANTLLVPLVGFIALPLGLSGLVLLPIQDSLALCLFHLGGWVVECCLWVILRLSSLSWAYFWIGTLSVGVLAAYYAGLLILHVSWPWKRRSAAIAGLSLLALSFQFLPSWALGRDGASLLKVNVIDVGQGSSTLLRFPTGETMLVDGGGFYDDSFDIGRTALAPFLWQAGVSSLDHVILTHDHPDHRNGLKFILSHFPVGCFWETGLSADRGIETQLASIAAKRHIPILRVSEIQGERELGGCRLSVLHPSLDYLEHFWDREDLNNASIVLLVKFGNTHVLLPGDIDRSVEERLRLDPDDDSRNLLVAAHHGSNRSTGGLLLDRFRPEAVLLSCGRDNLFGFPSEAVLRRCRERRIPVFRTDVHGAVEAVSNGAQWQINTFVQSQVGK